MRTGECWPEGEEPIEDSGGTVSRLAGLHRKGVLTGELFCISRDWLTLRGQSPMVSKAPDIKTAEKILNTHPQVTSPCGLDFLKYGGWVPREKEPG